jgi:hypothetical protein
MTLWAKEMTLWVKDRRGARGPGDMTDSGRGS